MKTFSSFAAYPPFLRRLFMLNNFSIPSCSPFLFRYSIFSVISSEPKSESSQGSSYSFILHSISLSFCYRSSSWWFFMINLFFKSSSRFLSVEFKYLFFSRQEVQLILHFLLKWSFAFLRSSKLSNHFRLWSVITS